MYELIIYYSDNTSSVYEIITLPLALHLIKMHNKTCIEKEIQITEVNLKYKK